MWYVWEPRFHGAGGRVSLPRQKLLEYCNFTLWALRLPTVRPKVALMVCGRFCRAFEFQRPLLGVLNQ
eukprot:10761459-Heterocapsa_arctica.AAC.1